MKIGVISDTHGRFDPQFREFLEPCDELWHAGDFGGGFQTAADIAAFKPLVGVVGNCDERGLIHDYPIHQYFEREGQRILMTHIGGFPGKYDYHALQLIERYHPNVFVCGHSHILRVMHDKKHNMICINPGAAGLQGYHIVRTAIRFDINVLGFSNLEIFELPRD